MQTQVGGRTRGRQLHRAARPPRHHAQFGHRRDLPVARSRPARRAIATRSPASTRTSGSSKALSINGFLAKSFTPGAAGGELAGKGSVTWNDNFLHTQYSLLTVGDDFRDDIGFIKRRGVRKHFADFGIRFAARVVAQDRHPRAAPAHALQHLHRSVEPEGDAHQPRRDGVVLRARRLRRAAMEPALRAHHGAVPDSAATRHLRLAAMAGTSSRSSSRPITAGRCPARR